MAHGTVEWFGSATIRKIALVKGSRPEVQAISGLLRARMTWDRGQGGLDVMQGEDETPRAFWQRVIDELGLPDVCPSCGGEWNVGATTRANVPEAALAQVTRERDEAMTLANSLRVCLDAAEAERTSLHARLAAAEAEVAELRPYKAALEALEVWCADPGYEISGHDAGWGAWQPDSREAGRITLVTQQSSPLALGAAVAAREAMGEATQAEEAGYYLALAEAAEAMTEEVADHGGSSSPDDGPAR